MKTITTKYNGTEEWTCEIIDGHCFSEGDTDDGYCKMCNQPKPDPYIDRSEYEKWDKDYGK